MSAACLHEPSAVALHGCGRLEDDNDHGLMEMRESLSIVPDW